MNFLNIFQFLLKMNSLNSFISLPETETQNYTKKTTRGRKRSFEPSDRTKKSDEFDFYGKSKLSRRAIRKILGGVK